MVVIVFGYLLSIFRMKYGGYPYRFERCGYYSSYWYYVCVSLVFCLGEKRSGTFVVGVAVICG